MDMLAMKSDRKKGALAKIVHIVSVIGMKKIPNIVRRLTDF